MVKKVKKMIKKSWESQPIRYLLVGGVNTLISYCLYAGLIYLGLHYVLAVLISTVIGVIISFNTQGRLVFKNFKAKQFLKYGLMVAVMFCLNIGLIHGFYKLGLNYYWAGLLSTALMAGLGYFLNKYWIFTCKFE